MLRKTVYLFFILLSAVMLGWSLYSCFAYGFVTGRVWGLGLTGGYLLLHVLLLRSKWKHTDILLGAFNFAIAAYLSLAVLDDFFDWKRGEDTYSDPAATFILPFVLVGLSLLASLMMAFNRRNLRLG